MRTGPHHLPKKVTQKQPVNHIGSSDEPPTIADWFKANKLTVNVSKTFCMLFSPHTKGIPHHQEDPIEVLFEGESIPFVHSTRFLGVTIDDKLTWQSHYNNVILKMKRNIHMLQDGQNLLTQQAKKILYYGHVFSHLNYCIGTWGNMVSACHITKLQKVQNKCINLIDTRKVNLSRKFHDNKILQVKDIIHLENCKLGFKVVNDLLPVKIMEEIKTDHTNKDLTKRPGYNTRFKSIPNSPLMKDSRYKNSFLTLAMKSFQPLLAITKPGMTLSQFVIAYKRNHFGQ